MTSKASTKTDYNQAKGVANAELTAALAALVAATGYDVPAAARRVRRAQEKVNQVTTGVNSLGG